MRCKRSYFSVKTHEQRPLTSITSDASYVSQIYLIQIFSEDNDVFHKLRDGEHFYLDFRSSLKGIALMTWFSVVYYQ